IGTGSGGKDEMVLTGSADQRVVAIRPVDESGAARLGAVVLVPDDIIELVTGQSSVARGAETIDVGQQEIFDTRREGPRRAAVRHDRVEPAGIDDGVIRVHP